MKTVEELAKARVIGLVIDWHDEIDGKDMEQLFIDGHRARDAEVESLRSQLDAAEKERDKAVAEIERIPLLPLPLGRGERGIRMSEPTQVEIEKAHTEIAQTYLSCMLELMAMSGQDEVNFMKKSVETPGGGVYLMQFQHVSGPKISLKALFPSTPKAAARAEGVKA